jgi:hypothetical protein
MTRWAVFWTTVLTSMLGTTSLALADPPDKAAIEADNRYYVTGQSGPLLTQAVQI